MQTARVRHELLPFQELIFQDQQTAEFALVGGVGAGKTVFQCFWLHNKCMQIPGGNFWFCSRTHKTAKDPGIKTYLEMLRHLGLRNGIDFTFNKGESRLTYAWGSVVTWMSSESYKDWVGASLAGAVGDEPAYWPDGAYRELTYRLRPGLYEKSSYVHQLLLGGTPQGLTWYANEFSGADFAPVGTVIDIGDTEYPIAFRSKTKNRFALHYPTFLNPFQTKDYIDKILDNYGHDPAMIRAHLFGEFCPLFEKAVYKFKDENIDGFNPDPTKSDHVHLGFDFNVGKMAWVGGQRIGETLYLNAEAEDGIVNTDEACDDIINTYPKHSWGDKVAIIDGDSSGYAGDTRGEVTDYDIIRHRLKSHFSNVRIRVPDANPSVRSRILATNRALSHNPSTDKDINLYIANNCQYTIDAMYKTVYSAKGNDIYKPSDDNITHRSDAASYKAREEFPFESVGSVGVSW